MIQFRDANTGKWWDGKAFVGAVQEMAKPYPHEVEKEMVKEMLKQAQLANVALTVEVHGYVSSKNLAKESSAALELTHSKKLQKLADEVIVSLAATGEKYLSLCTYIRENQVAPKLVSFELAAKGFTRQTISKINTVANASEEKWNEYAARKIGFNKVLAMSSGNVQKAIAEKAGADVVEVQAEVTRLDEDEETGPATESTPEQKKAKWEKTLETAATSVLRAASALGLRGKTINGNNGYAVVIKKLPVVSKKGAKDEASKAA